MKRKQQVDPKKLRKHSAIVKHEAEFDAFTVPGERVRTDTGFKVEGTVCDDFETYYEYLAEGQLSARYLHATKTRSFRVLAGQGVLVVYKDDDSRALALVSGTEITAVPGIAYEVRSSPNTTLELFVTQSAKYDDDLQVVKEYNLVPAVLTDEQLRPISREEALRNNLPITSTRRPRSLQKAAQQQTAKAAEAGRLVSAPEPAGGAAGPVINVRPSMGNFDLEGAG